MDLTEEDVLEILRLLEQSKFDFIQLEQGDLKLTISRGDRAPLSAWRAEVSNAAPSAAPWRRSEAEASRPLVADGAAFEAGLVPVTAAMVGKFYAASSPTEPPYVQKGSHVEKGATIGLIEVMKVFTSVQTEIAGVIESILVADGQSVEYGQPLFLIRPGSAPKGVDAA